MKSASCALGQIVGIAALTLLGACGDGGDRAARIDGAIAEPGASQPVSITPVAPEPVVSLSSADKGRACRAVVASLNQRDPAIIRVISSEGDQIRVRYTRDDGKVWTNDCIIGNGTAQWRMVENGQPGRWRDSEPVNFTIDGQKIDVQTFMGGEVITSDSYTVE